MCEWQKCWASASECERWCQSADEHQWMYEHRVWEPTKAAKPDWASCNRDKACGFRTNTATEPPLDQSWSHCCCRGAQLSVSWRTTAVISWEWKQNCQILWRSSTVLKLAVLRQFSNKKRQCVIVAWRDMYDFCSFCDLCCLVLILLELAPHEHFQMNLNQNTKVFFNENLYLKMMSAK